MILIVLRSTGKVFCGVFLSLCLADIVLMVRLELWLAGRKTTKCHLQHNISVVHVINLTGDVTSDVN